MLHYQVQLTVATVPVAIDQQQAVSRQVIKRSLLGVSAAVLFAGCQGSRSNLPSLKRAQLDVRWTLS